MIPGTDTRTPAATMHSPASTRPAGKPAGTSSHSPGRPGDAAVIDLACGTGVTTEAILAALGPDGRVTGVDGSAAMLAVAASSVTDRRVTWIHARAENLDQGMVGLAHAVVCNSAIWQTDLDATMRTVRNVLAEDGRFVFNVGSPFLRRRNLHLLMRRLRWVP